MAGGRVQVSQVLPSTRVTSAVSRLGPDQVDGYQPPGEEVASLAPPQHSVTFMCPEMDRS